MKKEFENINHKDDTTTRETVSILSLILSVVLLLALLTRDTVLGSFGLLISNMTLGIFGFAAYAMVSFGIITSVVALFTKKSKNNGMIIIALCVMLFSALIALQVWTANAGLIIDDKLTFSEFLEQSYKLEAEGIYGSSAGGVIMSAIIYYPVSILGVNGTYIVSAVLLTIGVFGGIAGMKTKFSSEVMQKVNSKSKSQQKDSLEEFTKGKNAVKVGFGTSIGELRTGKADPNDNFQQGDFYNRQSNVDAEPEVEQRLSAQEILYGRPPITANQPQEEQVVEQSNDAQYGDMKGSRRNAKLFISNVGKTTSLNQKSKREINQEVKQNKKAKDILFSNEEDSSFTINNTNRPRNLSEDRNHFDQRVDTIRENDPRNNILSNNYGGEYVTPKFEDAGIIDDDNYKKPFIKIDDNVNVNEKRNEDNLVSRKALFNNNSTNVEVTSNEQTADNVHYTDNQLSTATETRTVNNIVKPQRPAEDPHVDMFRITKPKVPPKILTSKDVKKKAPVVQIVEEVVVVPEKFNILEPRTTMTNAYADTEEFKTSTKEFKDLLASGKLKNRVLEVPQVDYSFEKKITKDVANIKILTSIDQLNGGKKPEDKIDNSSAPSSLSSSFTKAILHAPIDDVFNEIKLDQLSNPQMVEENKKYAVGAFFKDGININSVEQTVENNKPANQRKPVEEIINMPQETHREKVIIESHVIPQVRNLFQPESSVEVEERKVVSQENTAEIINDNSNGNKANDNTTHSVFYPLNQVKPIKTANGEVASQLPIIAKETYQAPASISKAKVPYAFPPLDLLDDAKMNTNKISEETEAKAIALEEILKSFSINAKVVETVVGPSVTRYELEIQQGTQVKRIEQISKDITMGLESPSEVIILAPIPGKNRVGIEVPNRIKDTVTIKSVIDTDTFRNSESRIAFALGKQVDGTNVMCDIAKMPHMLIAGSTGTGKSVALNTILISLLYNATPDDVRIILIDPKRVEFTAYRGLPHLLIDEIIYDSEKAISSLNWAIDEMERRFMLFQAVIARDLDSYNGKLLPNEKKLPRIVIIMDELADLMSMNKKELEEKIMRIAQKSRAAGIHLVLATQRPSVNVITGVIKTNLPSRISFKLSNGVDSKTVLDEVGAEKLLGAGDMFFKPVTAPEKIRLQGCFVSSKEVEKVVNYVVTHNKAEYDSKAKEQIVYTKKEKEASNSQNGEGETQLDDKFVDALKLAIDSSQISISMIQRRYNVGFNRAGKILDTMEKLGYVSAFNGSKPREVKITREQFEKEFGEY